jgi:predicted SnoaL-like aldol condensation-catalyzing enzyme
MTREPPVQRPLSRAYLSVCSASRSQNKQVQDEKNASVDYMADVTKKHANFKEEHVRARVRSNLI